MRSLPLRCILLLILLTTTVRADDEVDLLDLSIKQLRELSVITTSQSSKPLIHADGIVSVITKEQIEILGARNLLDVINRLPATLIIADSSTLADIISVRGDRPIASEHVVVLLNGQPFRTTAFSNGATRQLLYALPLSAVQRIEFVQGPGSILYGSNAFTAVLNIITIPVKENSGFIKLTTGDYQTQKLESGFTLLKDAFTAEIAGQITQMKGWETSFFNINQSPTDYTLKDNSYAVFGKIDYNNWSLTLLEEQLKFLFYGLKAPLSTNDKAINKSSFLNLNHKLDMSDSWQMKNKLSWLNFKTEFIESTEVNYDIQNRVSWSEQDSLLFGGNIYHLKDATSISDKPEIQITQHSLTNYHLYSQLETSFKKALISLGLMWLKYQDSDGIYTPKLSIVYGFNNNWHSKLIYSKGYRQPNAFETNLDIFGGFAIGNKDLVPEQVATTELLLSYNQENLYIAASLFNSKQEDLIKDQFSTQPRPQFTFINGTARKFFGATIESEYRMGNFGIDASYSWQKNKQQANENEIEIDDVTQLPRHLFKLAFYYKRENYNIGLFDSYHSGFKYITQPGATFLNKTAASIHNVSLNLTWKPTNDVLRNTKFSLYIHNLLNKNIDVRHFTVNDVGAYPMDTSRAMYLSIEKKF